MDPLLDLQLVLIQSHREFTHALESFRDSLVRYLPQRRLPVGNLAVSRGYSKRRGKSACVQPELTQLGGIAYI
ncbi:unannotated protein [freshwater metagenome]|uniref:Unannotated protein n=1 Tax=freshwater metagenome TaxID=449393 RepID=A0A6J6UND8_9ZZZZ